MLVLSRNRGESICIGDDIRITITAVQGERVRLGIEAPRELPVNREEIRAQSRRLRMAVSGRFRHHKMPR